MSTMREEVGMMMGIRKTRIAIILLCISASVLLPDYGNSHIGVPADFAEILHGARCVELHKDPYDPNTVLRELRSEGSRFPSDPTSAKRDRIVAAVQVNLPTALFIVRPLAMLPEDVCAMVWLFLTFSLLALAGYLMWDLGTESPVLCGWMIAFVLLNCEVLALVGNVSGIAVGLCLIAVWCFLEDRCSLAGVVMLAISLVLKPHDSGFIWLFFVLKGGVARKRALQTLGVVGLLALGAEIWIAPSSPHWISELQNNLALVSAHGGTSDPGLSGLLSTGAASVINLQGALSVLLNHPQFYNFTSYIVSGVSILAWLTGVLRKRLCEENSLLALAAISALTLLPVYHRPYDAKLLLLSIPACVVLCKQSGWMRWTALLMTSVAIVATSDIPLMGLTAIARVMGISTSSLAGKLAIIVLLRPAPPTLLLLGCFYLWVFLRYSPPTGQSARGEAARNTIIATVT